MLKALLLRNMRRAAPEPAKKSLVVRFQLHLQELHVGTLTFRDGVWTFTYSDEFREQDIYPAIVDFPHKDRDYRSEILWPFFALRIPSVNQHAVKRYMAEEKVQEPTAVDLMKKFGRRAAANPYELEAMQDGALVAAG